MAAVPYEGHAAAAPFRSGQSEGEATRLLYERHQRKILSFCQHQLGNREEAEDATQITFLNAFRGLKRGTSPEFESAWLYKIAHNVCLTKQRNSYRRRLVEAPSDFELIEEVVPAHEGESDELFGLSSALRVLPEQQRRALLLREWKGLSYREIADEMQLSQAAVETLLFRARRSLADALTNDRAERRGRGRPRLTSNTAPSVAALKSVLFGGGFKVAATAATVAATSVVAATPVVRHDVGAVMRSDAAGRPAPVIPLHTHAAHAVVRAARPTTPRAFSAPHATANVARPAVVAPVAQLHLVAAPRAVAPAAPALAVTPAPVHHDVVPAPVAAAPVLGAAAAPATGEPPAIVPAPVAEATDPVVSQPAPSVVDVPVAVPAPAPVPASAPVQSRPAPPAPPAPGPPTVTIESVNQPAPDPTAPADAAPASSPASVPPGQAKRYDTAAASSAPPADPSATPAPTPAPAVATTDTTTDSAPASTPPGQAKKADDTGSSSDGRGNGRTKSDQ
jgi:RNA polymerase sigma factor (sigma-70 family)